MAQTLLGAQPLYPVIGAAGPIALALVIACGFGVVPGITVGFITPMIAEGLYKPAGAIVLIYLPAYCAIAYVVRGVVGRKPSWFRDERTTIAFLLAAVVAPLLTGLPSMYLLRPIVPGNSADMSWINPVFLLRHWSREIAGFLSFGPFVLVWCDSEKRGSIRRNVLWEIPAYGTLAPLLLGCTVWIKVNFQLRTTWLSLLPLIATARHGIALGSAALAASAFTGAVAWVQFGWSAQMDDTALRTLLITTALPVILLSALTEQRSKARMELERIEQEFRSLAAHREAVRERERTQLGVLVAQELRPGLTRMRNHIAVASDAKHSGDDQQFRRVLEDAAHGVDGLIQTVRRIATGLRPGVLDSLGLEAALEWLTRDFRSRYQIPCTLRVSRHDPVPAPIATVYFRLVEDLLDRIRSTQEKEDPTVTISLEGSASQVCLRVECEGAANMREVEWLSLQQKVVAIGGTMSSRMRNASVREFVARASA